MVKTKRVALTQAEARHIYSKMFNRPLPRTVICRISKQSDKFWEHGTQNYRMRETLFPEFEDHLYKQLK